MKNITNNVNKNVYIPTANYISNTIPFNVKNPEIAKKHYRHVPYSCDFLEPIHLEDDEERPKKFSLFANQ